MGVNPGELWLQEAFALRQQGDLHGALNCLRRCVTELPECAEAHFNLGTLLAMLGKLDEAMPHYRETLRLAPRFERAHNNLAAALLACGRVREAVEHFTQAVASKPDYAEAHYGLASAYLDLGDTQQAQQHFRQAAGNRAYLSRSLLKLAAHGLYTPSEPSMDQLRTWLSGPNVPPEAASHLHFTLGYLLDLAGAWDLAFPHFLEGNALWRSVLQKRGLAFDRDAHSQRVDKLIATFSAEYFCNLKGLGVESRVPVFIVGMPRSGTTLVEQILSHHPQVFGAGELHDMDRTVTELSARLGGTSTSILDPSLAREMATAYLARLAELGGAADRVTDKLPENFLHLGFIASLLPSARVIICRRDPRDVCLSCFFNFFSSASYTWSLEDLGSYHRDCERLLVHWRQVLPLSMLEVVYEDLVRDQETVSRRLVEFCGLPWDERCLKFHENPRPVQTLSSTQVRRPMYTSALGRWRNYAAHLGPLLQALA